MGIKVVLRILDVLMIKINGTNRTDVVDVINVDKASRTNNVLTGVTTVVVSRRHTKPLSKRLIVILPATRRVIHLLLHERVYVIR